MSLIQDFARQAIETRYLGPTNHRGARVKATSSGGTTVTLDWDHALNAFENHRLAAETLLKELQWDRANDYAGGQTRDGYTWVLLVKSVR